MAPRLQGLSPSIARWEAADSSTPDHTSLCKRVPTVLPDHVDGEPDRP